MLKPWIIVLVTAFFLTGCRATQPVKWKYHAPLDAQRGGRVQVSASTPVPQENLDTLRRDIQRRVSEVLMGNSHDPDVYRVDVVITRYDEGNTLIRLFSLGLFGRIYLDGEVTLRDGQPPEIISYGTFEKWYGPMLPLGNIFSTMERSVMPKVGRAVARAVKASTKKD